MQLRGLPLVAVAIAAALIAANPSRVVALDEESIPSADLTATPTASPSPGAEGLSGAVATAVATSTPMMFPEPTPIAAATDEGSPEINGSAPAAQVSDLPLDSAIDAAQTDPARAASMRVAELARQELVAGHPDEAIRTLQRAMSIDSSDPYAYFYLGRAALAKKQFQQAMVFFKRAEIGFGQNPIWLGETLAYEGLTYELSDHLVAAEAAYQQALGISPGNLMARVGYTRTAPEVEPAAATTPTGAPGGEGPPSAPSMAPPSTAPPSAPPPTAPRQSY